MYIPFELMVPIIIGGLIGYYLTLSLQIVVFVLVFLYFFRHSYGFYYIVFIFAGMALGDIFFIIPYLDFSVGQIPNSKNYFWR
jgi:hypothetical protein